MSGRRKAGQNQESPGQLVLVAGLLRGEDLKGVRRQFSHGPLTRVQAAAGSLLVVPLRLVKLVRLFLVLALGLVEPTIVIVAGDDLATPVVALNKNGAVLRLPCSLLTHTLSNRCRSADLSPLPAGM